MSAEKKKKRKNEKEEKRLGLGEAGPRGGRPGRPREATRLEHEKKIAETMEVSQKKIVDALRLHSGDICGEEFSKLQRDA